MVSMKNLVISTTVFLLLLTPSLTFAAGTETSTCPDGKTCLENPLKNQSVKAGAIIQTIITGALGIVGALTLLMLVLGGFKWLTSAGNAEKVEEGTKTMVWAVIGLFLVFASYLLLTTFTSFLTAGKAP